MKKISLFIFSLISAIAMSACDNAAEEERDMDPYDNDPDVTNPDRYDRDDNFDLPDEDEFNIPDEDEFDLPDEDEGLNRVPDNDVNEGIRDRRDRIANDNEEDEDEKPENTVD
ncbi:hypothetical protein [Haloplasma contractile]|uniref:Membrane lipoprotein n=1 Tax=Haloplasma contractile SSD-17B TaxID=1033810 RepID=F7PVD0_9MOLU|nr:hypothetical protein [Haloplasma contractile]ERJ12905.1 membrane lipoprotein [Haloplasma contractile SSD-17B]